MRKGASRKKDGKMKERRAKKNKDTGKVRQRRGKLEVWGWGRLAL